jgi:multiple sugar transport system permease protein
MNARAGAADGEISRPLEALPSRLNAGAGAVGWFFVLPALLVLAVFFFVPVLAALLMSLTDFDLYALRDWHNLRFVGFANYAELLQEPLFWKSLGNTLYFVLVGVPLSIAVSLGAALLVNARAARLKGLFRTVFFAPVVTTLVAVAVVWRYIFHTRYGFLNYVLDALGIGAIDWMGNPHWAMPAIIVLAVWKNFGYNMIIFLAALQSIPEDLYEAARIDGASGRQLFWHITLPSLRPVLLLVSLLTITGYFQLFAEPYVMTEGGPLQSTLSVLYFMYEEGFKWWNLGRSSAVAFLLFLLIFAVTLVQLRLGRKGMQP